MKDQRPKVLIGPFNRRQPGGVAAVHAQFQAGLGGQFRFIPHYADRTSGTTRPGLFSVRNLVFALRDVATWIGHLLRHRPAMAHYAITSLWNAEKSLLMLALARPFGTRTLAHLHGGAFLKFWGGLGPFRSRLLRRAVEGLDALVVLSEGWREQIVGTLRIAPQRVYVVPNPIDPVFEHSALAMPVVRPATNILALGALSRLKGSSDLLDTMARMPATLSARMLLVGPEREPGIRASLTETIQREKLASRVELRPPAVGEEKLELFRNTAIFVLPSYVENLPVVVLEAAASGLAIVATPVGALPEFFHDGESIVFVPPGDVEKLATVLENLCGNPQRRHALGEAARTVFRTHFMHGMIMRRMEEVYRTVLDANAGSTTSSGGEAR